MIDTNYKKEIIKNYFNEAFTNYKKLLLNAYFYKDGKERDTFVKDGIKDIVNDLEKKIKEIKVGLGDLKLDKVASKAYNFYESLKVIHEKGRKPLERAVSNLDINFLNPLKKPTYDNEHKMELDKEKDKFKDMMMYNELTEEKYKQYKQHKLEQNEFNNEMDNYIIENIDKINLIRKLSKYIDKDKEKKEQKEENKIEKNSDNKDDKEEEDKKEEIKFGKRHNQNTRLRENRRKRKEDKEHQEMEEMFQCSHKDPSKKITPQITQSFINKISNYNPKK